MLIHPIELHHRARAHIASLEREVQIARIIGRRRLGSKSKRSIHPARLREARALLEALERQLHEGRQREALRRIRDLIEDAELR